MHVQDVIGTTMPTIKGLVIGGDFNTNHDQTMFARNEHSMLSQMLDTRAALKDYL